MRLVVQTVEEGTSDREHVLPGGGAGGDANGSPPPTGAALGPMNQEENKCSITVCQASQPEESQGSSYRLGHTMLPLALL